jgi:hypothetical protein
VQQVQAGTAIAGISPLEVAERILDHSQRALALLAGIRHGGNDELRRTLTDIETMAYLGMHYGHKIRGATELALFRATNDPRRQVAAVEALEEAARSWRMYTSLALSQYANPLWTNRVGHVDWRRTMTEVLNDIALAGGEPTIRNSLPERVGGTILEAASEEASWIEWTFDAPEAGRYLLDIRYAIGDGIFPAALTVNEGEGIPFTFWTTGGDDIWAWDMVPAELARGTNRIRLTTGEGSPRVDRLRVEATR